MKLIYLFFLLLSAIILRAQDSTITVKVSDLPPEVYNQIHAKQQLATVSGWVGVGKEIGQAFDGALGAVQSHATSLADSKLGTYIMILVAWKVLGNDLIQFLVGVPLLIAVMIIHVWSYRKTCMTRRVKIKGGKEPEWKLVEPTGTLNDQQGAQFAHAGSFLLSISLSLVVIFA